jgi:hypothetical protein
MKRRYLFPLILVSTFLLLGAYVRRGQTPLINAREDIFVYLPIMLGGASSSTIPNGDFEAGRTIWTESSLWSNILIVMDQNLPPGIAPHNGDWAAWLGGDNDELAAIEQRVLISSAAPYLAFWHWLDWPFACQGASGAEAQILVNQTTVYQTDVCEDTDTGGWVQQTVDLGTFAGQTVDLRLQMTTESNSFANWYLDDITLQTAP